MAFDCRLYTDYGYIPHTIPIKETYPFNLLTDVCTVPVFSCKQQSFQSDGKVGQLNIIHAPNDNSFINKISSL